MDEARPIAFPEANGWAEGKDAEGTPYSLGDDGNTMVAITCWELDDDAIAEVIRTRCIYVGVRGPKPVAMWVKAIRRNVFYRTTPKESPDA